MVNFMIIRLMAARMAQDLSKRPNVQMGTRKPQLTPTLTIPLDVWTFGRLDVFPARLDPGFGQITNYSIYLNPIIGTLQSSILLLCSVFHTVAVASSS